MSDPISDAFKAGAVWPTPVLPDSDLPLSAPFPLLHHTDLEVRHIGIGTYPGITGIIEIPRVGWLLDLWLHTTHVATRIEIWLNSTVALFSYVELPPNRWWRVYHDTRAWRACIRHEEMPLYALLQTQWASTQLKVETDPAASYSVAMTIKQVGGQARLGAEWLG